MSIWSDLAIEYPAHGVVTTTRSTNWWDAMIAGNGSIGVLVPGNPVRESLIFSHERLFLPYNPPMEPVRFAPHIDRYRRLIEEGRADECAKTMWEDSGLAELIWTDPFVPAFQLDLEIADLEAEEEVLRKTDYSTGVVTTCFKSTCGGRIQKDYFVSRADGIAVVRVQSDQPFCCSVRLGLVPVDDSKMSSRHAAVVGTVEVNYESLLATLHVSYKNQWEMRPGGCAAAMKITCDGVCVSQEDALSITNASNVLLAISLQVPRNPSKPSVADAVAEVERAPSEFSQLLKCHAAIHGEMFNRVSFSLGAEQPPIETDRLLPGKSEPVSTRLVQQTFDAARYAIICSTGELPPNLQGVWTGSWGPAWCGDYTMNGNVNTAIASAFNGNCIEVMESMINYLEYLTPDFRENAKRIFGCRGLLVPGRASNRGFSNHFMAGFPHHFWIAANGWYAQYFFDYWQYTQDETFLKERAIPFMLEAAQFYEDFLYLQDGKVRICPSYSPENRPLGQDYPLTYNATMDVGAIKELFRNLLSLRDREDIPVTRVDTWERLIAAMPEYAIDETGAFKEWLSQDIKENQKHRHASQLYPLYHEVDPDIAASKVLQEACKQTIEQRLVDRRENNGGVMAFGLYQLAQAAANLKDAGHAEECIQWMSRSYWSPAFTCYHNPNSMTAIFNTDICGGLPAAIIQCLMQSSLTQIELLPVLPDSWPDGSITGICARGGITLDIEWRDRRLQRVRMCSNNDRTMTIVYGELRREVAFEAGAAVALDSTLCPVRRCVMNDEKKGGAGLSR